MKELRINAWWEWSGRVDVDVEIACAKRWITKSDCDDDVDMRNHRYGIV